MLSSFFSIVRILLGFSDEYRKIILFLLKNSITDELHPRNILRSWVKLGKVFRGVLQRENNLLPLHSHLRGELV